MSTAELDGSRQFNARTIRVVLPLTRYQISIRRAKERFQTIGGSQTGYGPARYDRSEATVSRTYGRMGPPPRCGGPNFWAWTRFMITLRPLPIERLPLAPFSKADCPKDIIIPSPARGRLLRRRSRIRGMETLASDRARAGAAMLRPLDNLASLGGRRTNCWLRRFHARGFGRRDRGRRRAVCAASGDDWCCSNPVCEWRDARDEAQFESNPPVIFGRGSTLARDPHVGT